MLGVTGLVIVGLAERPTHGTPSLSTIGLIAIAPPPRLPPSARSPRPPRRLSLPASFSPLPSTSALPVRMIIGKHRTGKRARRRHTLPGVTAYPSDPSRIWI